MHDAVLEAAGDLVAGVAEDLQHPDVVGQHLGDELLDADLAADLREVLEEQLADAALLVLVLHQEGDLRLVAARRRPAGSRSNWPIAIIRSATVRTSATRSWWSTSTNRLTSRSLSVGIAAKNR